MTHSLESLQLSDAQQYQLLAEWNETPVDNPSPPELGGIKGGACIHQLFSEQAERTPEAISVVFGDQAVTYHELNARANQLAHYLIAQGVGTDVLVGICVERSIEMMVGLLGILKAGGAYVPLDPEYPQERLQFMLADSEVKILLTQSSLVDTLCLPQNLSVFCLDQESALRDEHDSNPQIVVEPDNLAYCIYTSGSTGQPKGVLIAHRGVVNLLFWHQRAFSVTSQDRATQLAALAFDASVWEIWPYLVSGATLYLVEPEVMETIERLQEWLVSNEITITFLPTPLAELALSLQWPAEMALRMMLTGGDKLRHFPTHSLPFEFVNNYGPTENSVVTTSGIVVPDGRGTPSIGRPISNTQVYLLDQDGKPVSHGESGELHISGVGLARGYLNRPELTAKKFIKNPFSDDANSRLYKSGDLARYLPNGTLEFLGRIDHQVKIRGFRIELGEIEVALNNLVGVRQAVVDVHQDATGKRLVAYVIFDDDGVGSVAGLREQLTRSLPDYMIPHAFVSLEAMPLTPNGKIDRRALPSPREAIGGDSAEVAVTPVETILAAIWQEVLGMPVGIHEHFFEIGGDSLAAMQIVSRIRQSLQAELPLRDLWIKPTIAELAEQLTSTESALPPADSLRAAPLKPPARVEPLPLSFAQQRLWILTQLKGVREAYNIPVALCLCGPLDVASFRASWQVICERHEALRTTFPIVNRQAHQQINPASDNLEFRDLSDLPANEQEACVERLIASATHPFDLVNGPLWQVTLLRLSLDSHLLFLNMHHLITDGWSMDILMRELSALYAQQTDKLPEIPVQYADFTLWQREWLTGDVLQQHLAYWKKQIADAPPLLTLPTDHARPAEQSYRGARLSFTLPQPLHAELKKLSVQSGTTLFMTLQAAFALLLSRYSGTDDICIGIPIANRQVVELENAIGFFVNTLLLRNDLSGNPTFRDFLARVRQVTLDAYQWQALPFELLVETQKPSRSLSHNPLFQVMFTLEDNWQDALSFSDITVTPIEVQYPRAKFDLTLTMRENKNEGSLNQEGLIASWEYNTDLFEHATIERMAGHFQTLLASLVANPNQPIARLPLLTDAEKHNLLVEWNNTASDYLEDKCIHQLFEQQVARTPDAMAVVFGNEQLTYHELNRRANQLAHYLMAQGVAPDVLVGICVERSIEMVVGLLGVLKAGGAYVPLDPDYPAERLAFMFSDAQVQILLTQQRFVQVQEQAIVLESQVGQLLFLDTDWPTIAAHPHANPPNQISESGRSLGPDSLAYVIYTSGSTGRPKGVMVPHRAINRLVNNTNYIEIRASDRMAQASNASFDAATFEIWGALLHGACLVGIAHDVVISPPRLATELKQQKISILFLTTALFNEVVNFAPDAFSGLRYLLFGGEAVDPGAVRTLLDYGAPEHFLHVYGPTENTTYSSWYPIQSVPENAITVPIGKPIANTQIYILDGQLSPVPIGVDGELHVGGAGLAHGYLNRPQLTKEKFIPNPFGPGKLYKTGDLCRHLPDGSIEFIGRYDKQVKIRGFRIELGEIEAVLAQHPAVRQTVVIVRQGDSALKQLMAAVVPNQDPAPEPTELRDFLSEKLPSYMVPAFILILDHFPQTPNSKVDRKALSQIMPRSEELLGHFVAPRNKLEQELVQLWQDVLNIYPIGIQDNFFELGGNSLFILRFLHQLEKQLGLDLAPATILRHQTIEQLASEIASHKSQRHACVARNQETIIMLSDLQQKKFTRYFNAYDANGNGTLEQEDFELHVAKVVAARNAQPGSPTYDWVYNKWMKEWGRIKNFADVNYDNEVSLEEWFAFHEAEAQLDLPYWKVPEQGGITSIEFIFDIVDLDDNGEISWKEYSLFLGAYGIDWDLHQEIFQKLDLNEDGLLNRNEWVVLADQFFGDEPDVPGNLLLGPY